MPFMQNFVRVPNPYSYRCWRRAQHGPDGQCDAGCAAPIRDTLQRGVDGPVAAIMMEPIQGNGGGVVFPADSCARCAASRTSSARS